MQFNKRLRYLGRQLYGVDELRTQRSLRSLIESTKLINRPNNLIRYFTHMAFKNLKIIIVIRHVIRSDKYVNLRIQY